MVQPPRIASFTPDMLLVLLKHNELHMTNHDGITSYTCISNLEITDVSTLH